MKTIPQLKKHGYTPEYYYNKLKGIPAAKWCIGDYSRKRADGTGNLKDVGGHCGIKYGMTPETDYTLEAQGLVQTFKHYLDTEYHLVNDGLDERYTYEVPGVTMTRIDHPKQRVLHALTIAIDLANVEVMARDRNRLYALINYLERNPMGYKLEGYEVVKKEEGE